MTREKLSAGLERALEVLLHATVVVTTLLYSPWFDENVLAKGGVLLLSAGLVALVSGALVVVHCRLELPRLPVYLPLAAFFLWSCLSATQAANPLLGLENLLLWAAPFCLFLAVVLHGRRLALLNRVLGTMIGTSIVVSVLGILQYAGIDPLPGAYAAIPSSTLGNPNFSAYYHNLLLPILVAATVYQWRWLSPWRRAVAAGAVAVSSAHLLVAVSRAGWASAVFSVGLLLLVTSRPRLWTRRLPVVLLVALLLVPIAQVFLQSVPMGRQETLLDSTTRLTGEVWDRALTAFDTNDFSRYMRVLIWRDTISLIRAAPVLGVGPGHYWQAMTPHIHRQEWNELIRSRGQRIEPRHAHNEYLEYTAELGLVGLALLLWLLGSLLWLGYTYVRPLSRDRAGLSRPLRALSLGIACGLVGTLVHAGAGFNLHHPVVTLHLWLLLGVMVGLNERRPGRSAGLVCLPVRGWGWGLGAFAVATLLFVVLGRAGLGILVGDHQYQRAREHLARNEPIEAIRALARASSWRSHEFRYARELGRIALTYEREVEARAALRRALTLNPNDVGALRLLGTALIRAGDTTAVGVLERAVAGDPSSTRAHALRAQAYRMSGRPDTAAALLEAATEAQPGEPELLTALALAYLDLGQPDRGVGALEEAARLAPDDGRIAGNLGALYVETRRGAEAEAQLRRAIRLDPARHADWLANLSQALQLQGRLDEAKVAIAQALRLAPSNTQIQRWYDALLSGEG